jgi:hypothetical protein
MLNRNIAWTIVPILMTFGKYIMRHDAIPPAEESLRTVIPTLQHLRLLSQ